MLTPRELEVLDVVGEVMQERLAEQRAGYEGQLGELTAKVAALEARPVTDLAPITERLDFNLENLHERVMKMEALPPPITAEEILTLAQGALTSTRASLQEHLQISVVDLFKALPIPEKGEPGVPGKDGQGVTVKDFRALFDAAYAKFELETERRIMDTIQRTLDRIPLPKDGKDGADGLGFDDLDVVQTGDRTIEIRFMRAEKTKVFGFKFPWLIDRGVWKVGTVYERGDVVTWGGSSWIVVCDNPGGKPKDGVSPDWRLMAKSGRDGKDGERGLKGDPGKDGKTMQPNNGVMRGSAGP
jgi:hypothetical protein